MPVQICIKAFLSSFATSSWMLSCKNGHFTVVHVCPGVPDSLHFVVLLSYNDFQILSSLLLQSEISFIKVPILVLMLFLLSLFIPGERV